MSLFREWWYIGLVSFGGPGAHLGLFEEKFVGSLKISGRKFSEFLAMCSILPGPTSTQLATCIGAHSSRGGVLGGLNAFLCFSLPGLLIMTFAGLVAISGVETPWLASSSLDLLRKWIDCGALSIVTVAAVALLRKTCNYEIGLYLLAIFAAGVSIQPNLRSFVYPVICIVCGVLSEVAHRVGKWLFGRTRVRSHMLIPFLELKKDESPVSQFGSLCAFGAIFLIGISAYFSHSRLLMDMFSTGMFVFGGGSVAVPFLHSALVGAGLVSTRAFFTALSLMYICPGPMFNVSMYLGIIVAGTVQYGLACWVCMMLPGFLLVLFILPWWRSFQSILTERMPLFMDGLNAGACGLLIGAAIQLWKSFEPFHLIGVLTVFVGIVAEIIGHVQPHFVLLGALGLGIVDLQLFNLTGADLMAVPH